MNNNSQMTTDLKEYFSFVQDNNITLGELLSRYYAYHGYLNFGNRALLFETAKTLLLGLGDGSANDLQHLDVMDENGQLKREFTQRTCEGKTFPYFDRGDMSRFSKISILKVSKNEWQSGAFPTPFSMRLNPSERPPLDLFYSRSGHLFVSTYGYQYFDTRENCYWPCASSRAFGTNILAYPIKSVSQTVVIIQDEFNATNFAHFLYDYVPRIIYFCEQFDGDLSSVAFLVGGNKTPYHSLLIKHLCDRYRLDQRQFIFHSPKEIWALQSRLYFFSDQRMHNTHPMNICHPQTLRLSHAALSRLPTGSAVARNIYISRKEATSRRLDNEDAVIDALTALGYSSVTMSEHEPLTQIAILANAKSVIAPHGMGLTNIFFNGRSSKLLEIFNPNFGSDAYALICRSHGIGYNFLVGKNSNIKNSSNYIVDVDQVLHLAHD